MLQNKRKIGKVYRQEASVLPESKQWVFDTEGERKEEQEEFQETSSDLCSGGEDESGDQWQTNIQQVRQT